MPRLEVGQIIKTNYDTGPYSIEHIGRGCICTHYLDEIENIVNPCPPHLHLTVRDLKDKKLGWLNWYDENTLKSVGPTGPEGEVDEIIIMPNLAPVQLTLQI